MPRLLKKPIQSLWSFGLLGALFCVSGCSFLPDVRHKPQFHNPFPQIQTVAILPFRNQSQDPTLSGDRVSLAYYNELQSIPGFEILPVGVVKAQLLGFEQIVLGHPISTPDDFQGFARYMGVDAVLQGSITDFDSYYPPRMTLKVNWYAANEGFHPIPPGYGLPWGTKDEKKIDNSIRLEAERALAREQLASQTPIVVDHALKTASDSQSGIDLQRESDVSDFDASDVELASGEEPAVANENKKAIEELRIAIPDDESDAENIEPLPIPIELSEVQPEPPNVSTHGGLAVAELPERWPTPRGFLPPAPKSTRPVAKAQSSPIISHMKAYNGNDEDFTQKLSDYYYHRDDARFGGWEAYLQRSEDFIRFCTHLHIVETLAARGGQLESRTVVRWPINRYER